MESAGEGLRGAGAPEATASSLRCSEQRWVALQRRPHDSGCSPRPLGCLTGRTGPQLLQVL